MSEVIFLFIWILVTSLCEMSTTTTLNEANSCNILVVYREKTPNKLVLPSDVTYVRCRRYENEGYLFLSNIIKYNSMRNKVELNNIADGEWSCQLRTEEYSPGKDIPCTVHLEYLETRTNVAVDTEVILTLEKIIDEVPSTTPYATQMPSITAQLIIDEDPSTTPGATRVASPVTTQRIIIKDPSSTPDATHKSSITTQLIIDEDPSTTPGATRVASSVTTQRIIIKDPSSTPDATHKSSITTQLIIDEDPSTTPDDDMTPVTTQSPSNREVSLGFSPGQLAITTEANQINDAHSTHLNPWAWMIIGAVATGLIFICIINAIILSYCVKQRQRKAEELEYVEMNERLANRPPMRLPSDIEYDYVYSHRRMNRNNGCNTH